MKTVETAVPFAASPTMNGLIPTPKPTGGVLVERVTRHTHPFMLVNVKKTSLDEPGDMVMAAGSTDMPKSPDF